jgi:prolyl-tRNA synthetase
MAPFQVAIVPIGMGKSERVRETAQNLYEELRGKGVDVLLDDRDGRPGIMFADIELIGVPHRVVVGERGLKEGKVEYQGRRDEKAQAVPLAEAVQLVQSRISGV